MMDLFYFVSRGLMKLCGKAVKASMMNKISKIESGSPLVGTVFAGHFFCGCGKGVGS
jgi:hypothetical protein